MAWSYRNLLLCVLAAYLTLVLMFHSQLPLFSEERRKDEDGTRQQQQHRAVRSLMTERQNKTAVDVALVSPLVEPDAPLTTTKGELPRGCPSAGSAEQADFQRLGNTHYVYSAYYDDRVHGEAYVRVVALLRKGERPPVSCNMLLNDTDHVMQPSFYEMCENHAKDFGGWIISCRLPAATSPPCNVTLSLNNAEEPRHVTLPVRSTSAKPPMRDFGVCVSPLFGHIPSTTLVEFIELTLLLGAAHFTFYVHEVSMEMRRVLDYYSEQGVVSALPWGVPVPSRAVWYHGQLLAINDCLYRSMSSTHLVAFNDIDEFIVPQHHANWSAMVEHLVGGNTTSLKNYSGFSFQSAFFDPMLIGSAGSRVLYDLESDLRTKHLSQVRTKAMVSPRRLFELGIHHISRPLHEHWLPYDVRPTDAFLHHYRKCVTDFDPRMNCQVYKTDTSLSRHIPALRHSVHHTLWTLKERGQRKL